MTSYAVKIDTAGAIFSKGANGNRDEEVSPFGCLGTKVGNRAFQAKLRFNF
jgi:hypothetical protein